MSDASTRERATMDPADQIPAVHLYPRNPGYRRSGQLTAQPGDIALCGHVKHGPSRPHPPGSENCMMCARLAEINQ